MNKNYFITLLCFITFATQAFAYESSRQQKIDVVNSYQPTQFKIQDDNEDDKYKRAWSDLKYQAMQQNPQDLYVEAMPVDDSYVSTSPVARKNKISSEETLENMALEGSVLQEEKPKIKRICTRKNFNHLCTWLKGEPAPDALLLGMQAVHTDPNRADRNNTNNMLALQYGGIAAGTFKNSWHRDTCFLVASRRPWKKEFKNKDFSMDFQYKAGIMHGYENKAPVRLGWFEPVIVPSFGFNYKTSGVDIWVIPSLYPVFAASFRLGLPDPITYKSVHGKIRAKYPAKPAPILPSNEDSYEQIKESVPQNSTKL